MLAGDKGTHVEASEALQRVVREAGALAMRTFRTPLRSWMKHGSSPVTEADIAVDKLLRERLTAIVPEAGWLSEETEDDKARLSAARLWVVDPIDGTRAYLEGNEDWTISVALVETGRPVVATVYAPALDRLYFAEKGRGATLDRQRIAATSGNELAGARFAGPKRYLERLGSIAPIAPQPRLRSLALRLVRVASGELDAAFAGANSHDWDLAAADLLVHEAGGKLTTVQGETLVFNDAHPVHRPLLVAGRTRHEAILDLVRRRRTDFL